MKDFGLILIMLCASNPALAQDICFPPDAPYPYKLSKTDPLYATARNEHQTHLEQMETYVNCLDRERANALHQFKTSFDLFLNNFGDDAVMRFDSEQ